MYKRILLAYDGTLHGRTALREGALLAKQLGAEVFLLSVVAETAGARLARGAGGTGGAQHEDFRKILNEGVARLRRLGFDPKSHLAAGEPAMEIGAYATRIGADLVVVGHTRQSALQRWWSGPSGAHLVDYVHCTLLISRNEMSDAEFEKAIREAPFPAARLAVGAPPGVQPPETSAPAAEPPAADAIHTESAEPTLLPRPRRVRAILLLLLPLLLILAAIWYILGGGTVSIDDAYVEADKVGVSTDVSGLVREVRVAENQHVTAGAVLFVLEDEQFRYALQRAEALVATTRDQIQALKASYRDMLAQIKEATDDIEYFRTEYHRQQELWRVHVTSESNRDAARRNLENAEQRLASLKQQLASIAANLNEQPEGAVEDNPRYHDALAQRAEAARELEHTVVKAPFAGVVTDVSATAPGRYLAASTPAFYLVATDHVWVQANPKETEITYVRPGQASSVHVDIYPDHRWNGTVESISPAAAQEFSLLPAQNTSGNWVKVVQRVPLRIRIDTSDRDLPVLAAGLSAEVKIDTGHRRGLPHFLRGLDSSRPAR